MAFDDLEDEKAKKNPVQEMRLLMISLVHYLATKVLSRIIQLKNKRGK